MTVVLMIFRKILKQQSPMMVFYIKKKKNLYGCLDDTKYYFNKYFEMDTILSFSANRLFWT